MVHCTLIRRSVAGSNLDPGDFFFDLLSTFKLFP